MRADEHSTKPGPVADRPLVVMMRPNRRLAALGVAGLLLVAGCGLGNGGSPEPSGSPAGGGTTPSAAPGSPSLPPSVAPSPSPSASSSPVACTLPLPGPLASDTLLDAKLEHGPTADRLVFTFGTRPPEAIAEPTIGIVFAEPPFSMAGSGEPVSVTGDRFLKVRMDGMVVARPDGAPVYLGQRDLLLTGGTIPEAAMTDEFEGVVTWIVGLSGSGCPTVVRDSSGGEKLVIELGG
jgi:hypothetical protein